MLVSTSILYFGHFIKRNLAPEYFTENKNHYYKLIILFHLRDITNVFILHQSIERPPNKVVGRFWNFPSIQGPVGLTLAQEKISPVVAISMMQYIMF